MNQQHWLLVLLLLPHSLPAQGYAGAAACERCHKAEAATQSKSHHAGALRPMLGSPLAAKLLQAGQAPGSQVRYRETPEGVEAQGGQERALFTWAFGAGAQGMTPVGTLLGTAIEHRFSFYSQSNSLALTFGHPLRMTGPVAALGILQDGRTIRRCFGCHAIARDTERLEPIELGVRCERCHGSGAIHIQAVQAKLSPSEIRKGLLLNPGALPARAQVEICGACHRLPAPDSGDEPELEDPVSVRFAPIGLMASRCFRESKTLSCLTCHNPHEDARPASDRWYTEKCLACHTNVSTIKHCRRAEKANCLPCHMQRSSLGAALQFTNHRIRLP